MNRAVAYMGPRPGMAGRQRISSLAQAHRTNDSLRPAWAGGARNVDNSRRTLAFDGKPTGRVERFLLHLDLPDADPFRRYPAHGRPKLKHRSHSEVERLKTCGRRPDLLWFGKSLTTRRVTSFQGSAPSNKVRTARSNQRLNAKVPGTKQFPGLCYPDLAVGLTGFEPATP